VSPAFPSERTFAPVAARNAERRRVASFFGLAAFVFGSVYLGTTLLPDPRSDAALFLILGFVAFVFVAALVGSVVARFVYSKEPRFIRAPHDE
jgi:hypothetical protein